MEQRTSRILMSSVAVTVLAARVPPASAVVAPQSVTHFICQARQGTEAVFREGGPVVARSLGTYGWPGVEIRPDGSGG